MKKKYSTDCSWKLAVDINTNMIANSKNLYVLSLDSFKSRDHIKCECDHCGIEYETTKHKLQMKRNRGDVKLFCSRSCSSKSRKSKYTCIACGINFNGVRRSINKFCSSSCSASYNNSQRTIPNTCNYCDSIVNTRRKYCDTSCQKKHYAQITLDQWLNGSALGHYTNANNSLKSVIRDYLLEQANNKCTGCGFSDVNPVSGKSILQIDHIDGDSTNSKKDNLKVLCPNCHAMTPTYGNLNKGNSTRTNRHK